ncbi:DUF4190 domain-containing protein [Lentzea sp. BCCO 10_0798]|jgi:hypothetical protein|uniref:DUF4190 domain-containing protein n=1 Tax=Lentzea kristufekii TaxID=3095430 RepID=A0ABU4U2A7_9PSEU|nr:DUF4190 domain-containing protein [Lentzea sp. BCCO 10_0798]MDX8054641.1 DUF4190 domain-containing protein [Lentzea sp. BCCO 10_0798]
MTYDPYNPKQPGDPYGQQPPYGQPGQYGQQPMYGYGYPPPAPKQQTSAILALVLSLVGFATCGATAIVGVIFGHIAMGKIKRGEEEGHGMALAGIIVGYVVIVGYLLFVAIYVFAIFAAVNGGYR